MQIFGSVELAAKDKVVYLQNDWKDIMTTCRRKKKFIVCEMNNNDFFGANSIKKKHIESKK